MGLKKRSHVSPEFNLASMIDVIFLLLMFFMLSSKLVNTNALNLTLPSSSSKTSTPPNFVEVSIKSSGEFYLGTTLVQAANLKAQLTTKVEKAKATTAQAEDVTVVVSAEKGTKIEDVVQVMGLAEDLKIKMILATEDAAK